MRERLPLERAGFTKRFTLATDDEPMKIYFVANVYPDGKCGEVFIKASKSGTLVSGALDATSIMISLALQSGVPLETVVSKLRGLRFDPAGPTRDPLIPMCSSILDLLARWLEIKFLVPDGRIP